MANDVLESIQEAYGEMEAVSDELKSALGTGYEYATAATDFYDKYGGYLGLPGAGQGGDPMQPAPGLPFPGWLALPLEPDKPLGNAAVSLLQELWIRQPFEPADMRLIGGLDPMSGIAAPGTSFAELDPYDQRRYFANAIAQAATGLYPDKAAMQNAISGYFQRMRDLGWCKSRGGVDSIHSVDCDGTRYQWAPIIRLPRGSVPSEPTWDEILVSMQELYHRAKGTSMPALQVDGAVGQQQAWGVCLAEPDKEAKLACLEQYQGQVGVADMVKDIKEPWWRDLDPTKRVQSVLSRVDGKKYGVLKTGPQEFKGIELSVSMGIKIGLGAVVIGVPVALVSWMLLTKKGKRFWKRTF